MKTDNHFLDKYVIILSEYFTKDVIDDIINRWNEPHRYYHNLEHLFDMLKRIDDFFTQEDMEHLYMSDIYKNFIVAAFIHDVIYDPKSQFTNEDKSIEYFLDISKPNPIKQVFIVNMKQENIDMIVDMIRCTKFREIPKLDMTNTTMQNINSKFWYFDNAVLWDNTFEGLIEYENKIFKEFQFVDYNVYMPHRIKFIEKQINIFNNIDVTKELNFLIGYIRNRKIKVGIYSGSFNPLHLGHLDVLQKASLIFDKVIVAYGNNPEKLTRTSEIPKTLNYYQVDTYDGLVTDYIASIESKNVDVTLIRGLRNGADLDYEANQLAFIKDIKSNIKVVYIPCDKKFEHISSSAIRSLEKFDKDLATKYIVK